MRTRQNAKLNWHLARAGRTGESEAWLMSPPKQSAPYKDFARRLQEACDKALVPGGRQRTTAVAGHFGVSRETARLWFAGKALPELPRLIEMARDYRVDLHWLATGRVSPSLAGVKDEAAGYGDLLSADERLVIIGLRRLSAHRRRGLIAFLAPD